MKFLFFIIFTFFCLTSPMSVMAECLQGTVLRIDRNRGEVEIVVSQDGQCHLGNDARNLDGQGRGPAEKQRNIIVKAAWFPHCLSKGTEVYARGHFAAHSRDLFEAEDVFPCRRRGDHDPTGVRSRFNRHRKEMMPQLGGGQHE